MRSFFFSLFLCALSISWAADSSSSQGRAAWIKLEGDVDKGMADYTKRAIAEALSQNPSVIVFEINTFGGLLNEAFEIVDTITGIRGVPTVAYVTQKAISAGALIALSCERLYMRPSTTIGDCAPIIQNEEGPQILGEKIQSPLRAKFRNLAQRNGYPELLSESMVSPELEVLQLAKGDSIEYMESKDFEALNDQERAYWDRKTVVVHEGELLTMTDVEAWDLGFSNGTVGSAEELQDSLSVSSSFPVEISWAETFARWIGAISPLLMMLAFGALYMEFQTPGIGIFGVVGVALLAIVFGGQYIGGLGDKLPLVLLSIGILLIFVEILIVPGTWIAATFSLGFIAAALVLLFRDVSDKLPTFHVPGITLDSFQWVLVEVLGCALLGVLVPLVASRYLLSRLPSAVNPVLDQGLADAVSPQEWQETPVSVGDQGVTITLLKPTGRVRFGSQTLEVQSRDDFLEAGIAVHVVAVDGRRIVVARVKGSV